MTHAVLSNAIIDVGGGNGEISKYLQSINKDVVLLEPGYHGAKNAVRRGVNHVINSSLFDAGFIDGAFDTAISLDVLEHIEDDEKFLKEIFRILKPGGKLVLTVPAYQFLFSSFDEEVGHYRRYTLRGLSKKTKNQGFNIDYKTYFFSLLPIPILISRFILYKFKKKNKRKSMGHISKSGFFGGALRVLLWTEQLLMKSKIKIPFGSSCLLILHKPNTHER